MSRGSSRYGSRRQAGFTLVEGLVALAVLGMVVAMLYSNIAAGSTGLKRAAQERSAVALARARLESAGTAIPLNEGTLSGEEDGLTWQMTIERHRTAGGRNAQQRSPLSAWWVSVDVSWRDGPVSKERTLRLTTVKLGSGER